MNSVLEEAIREGRQKLSASSPALLDRLKAKDSATKQPKPLNVVILGGGICGLATSISLANRGHHVELFEEKEKISAVSSTVKSSSIPIVFPYCYATRQYGNASRGVWPRRVSRYISRSRPQY